MSEELKRYDEARAMLNGVTVTVDTTAQASEYFAAIERFVKAADALRLRSADVIPQPLTNALLDLQDVRVKADALGHSGNRMGALRLLSTSVQQVLECAESLRALSSETRPLTTNDVRTAVESWVNDDGFPAHVNSDAAFEHVATTLNTMRGEGSARQDTAREGEPLVNNLAEASMVTPPSALPDDVRTRILKYITDWRECDAAMARQFDGRGCKGCRTQAEDVQALLTFTLAVPSAPIPRPETVFDNSDLTPQESELMRDFYAGGFTREDGAAPILPREPESCPRCGAPVICTSRSTFEQYEPSTYSYAPNAFGAGVSGLAERIEAALHERFGAIIPFEEGKALGVVSRALRVAPKGEG